MLCVFVCLRVHVCVCLCSCKAEKEEQILTAVRENKHETLLLYTFVFGLLLYNETLKWDFLVGSNLYST